MDICGLDLSGSRYWYMAGFYEHGHEKLGSINLWNLLTRKGSIRFSRTLLVNTARAGICCHLNVRAHSMPFQEILNVVL